MWGLMKPMTNAMARRWLAAGAAVLIATGGSCDAGAAQSTAWPALGGNSDQQQYSALAQINNESVGRLGLAWYADMPSTSGLVGNPLVDGGTIYQSGP